MENIAQTSTVKDPDQDVLLLARLIVRDVTQLVTGIQIMVAVLLRYVAMAVSITNFLMGWTAPSVALEP